MTAPLTSAMLGFYRDTLGWLPDRPYMLLNRQVSRAWDWGGDWDQPEAVGALRRVLALDPAFRCWWRTATPTSSRRISPAR